MSELIDRKKLYKLNQHADKFWDRRTKRNRSRKAKRDKSIKESRDNG